MGLPGRIDLGFCLRRGMSRQFCRRLLVNFHHPFLAEGPFAYHKKYVSRLSSLL
jgi:hypothetical protein